jgi:hypothetical protein
VYDGLLEGCKTLRHVSTCKPWQRVREPLQQWLIDLLVSVPDAPLQTLCIGAAGGTDNHLWRDLERVMRDRAPLARFELAVRVQDSPEETASRILAVPAREVHVVPDHVSCERILQCTRAVSRATQDAVVVWHIGDNSRRDWLQANIGQLNIGRLHVNFV